MIAMVTNTLTDNISQNVTGSVHQTCHLGCVLFFSGKVGGVFGWGPKFINMTSISLTFPYTYVQFQKFAIYVIFISSFAYL